MYLYTIVFINSKSLSQSEPIESTVDSHFKNVSMLNFTFESSILDSKKEEFEKYFGFRNSCLGLCHFQLGLPFGSCYLGLTGTTPTVGNWLPNWHQFIILLYSKSLPIRNVHKRNFCLH